ncbi:16829_t:CDS:2, partial [Funneliformis caledonium]
KNKWHEDPSSSSVFQPSHKASVGAQFWQKIREEYKLAEMINEPSVHNYQPTLTNGRNNVNVSRTTNGGTFNSGPSEKNISKRDREE